MATKTGRGGRHWRSSVQRDAPGNLARTLMVVTMVIAVGTQYSVITAEDHDSSLTVLNEFDPFG